MRISVVLIEPHPKPLLVKKANTANTSAINTSSTKESNPSQQPLTPNEKVNQEVNSVGNVAKNMGNNPVISKTIKLTNSPSPVRWAPTLYT